MKPPSVMFFFKFHVWLLEGKWKVMERPEIYIVNSGLTPQFSQFIVHEMGLLKRVSILHKYHLKKSIQTSASLQSIFVQDPHAEVWELSPTKLQNGNFSMVLVWVNMILNGDNMGILLCWSMIRMMVIPMLNLFFYFTTSLTNHGNWIRGNPQDSHKFNRLVRLVNYDNLLWLYNWGSQHPAS